MIIGPYLYLWDLFPRLVLVIVASQVNHPTPVSRTKIVDLVGNNYTGLSDTTGDPPPDLTRERRPPEFSDSARNLKKRKNIYTVSVCTTSNPATSRLTDIYSLVRWGEKTTRRRKTKIFPLVRRNPKMVRWKLRGKSTSGRAVDLLHLYNPPRGEREEDLSVGMEKDMSMKHTSPRLHRTQGLHSRICQPLPRMSMTTEAQDIEMRATNQKQCRDTSHGQAVEAGGK